MEDKKEYTFKDLIAKCDKETPWGQTLQSMETPWGSVRKTSRAHFFVICGGHCTIAEKGFPAACT
jgi:hypothetical protein